MIAFPNAKINLGLNIIGKRSDWYHNLESCFYPIGWSDILEIIPATQLEFTSTGIGIPGNARDNLCLKAYHLLLQDFDIPPVKIHLHKVIPIGAGLGGGSSDGAFTLKTLSKMFKLHLSDTQLGNFASKLGSDCPFFIANHPKYVTGTGDSFDHIHIDLSGKQLVIITPEIHISTATAYGGVTPQLPLTNCKSIIEQSAINDWKQTLSNDFESSIFPIYPQIEQLKETLYEQGALYASMTGSGAAVFGIFDPDTNVSHPSSGYKVWKEILR